MPSDKISIVLVLKEFTYNNGASFNNLERFLRIGMLTYSRFMNVDDIADFFVIVPKADFDSIKRQLFAAYPDWPWRVIVEDVIVSRALPGGWAKQQTAKLAIASLVKTSHYLIIDDDTYLTKPMCPATDLFDEVGRALMNKCDIDFPFFFLWSAQVLEMDFDVVQNAPFHMAITPEIFVTDVVKAIIGELEGKYGTHMKWQEYLAEHKYTEYCMYWAYLLRSGETDKYYATNDERRLYGFATTGSEHNMPEQVRRSFTENKEKFFFSFVQSSLSHTIFDVEEEILKYL